MPKVTIKIVFALALLVVLPGTLANSATKVGNAQSTGLGQELGRADFVAYCAACHGVSGKGDGTVAEFLTITAVDLAQLRKMNAGSFPRERIHNVIDGRAEVKIHGARDMPVWGDWFEFEADASVAGRGPRKRLSLSASTRSSTTLKRFKRISCGSSAKEHGFQVVVRRQILAGGGTLAVAGVGATYFGLQQMGSIEEYNASIAVTRASLSQTPEMRDFVRYAILAANSHNTQPWRFRIDAGEMEILPDFSRRISVVDPDDHHIFASLGCATENLALAAGPCATALIKINWIRSK